MIKLKIVLAVPSCRPLNRGKFPNRVIKFAGEFSRLVPDYDVMLSHSASSSESHAVNTLIEEFRAEPSAQWFVLWDTRVIITPEQLTFLVKANRGVIGALCTTCEDPAQWDAAFYPDVLPDENSFLPVAELGAGVKVFHRSVFDLIEKDATNLAYVFDQSGRSLAGFCQNRTVEFGDYRRLLSPANYLDFLCRKSGLGIYAHAGVVLKRTGPDGLTYPKKEPHRSWLFRREPPPMCAEDLPEVTESDSEGAIIVVIQHCEKDYEQAARLYAAANFGPSKRKYTVILRGSPKGYSYPAGPNKLALDLMEGAAAGEDWARGAKCILLMEPDCVPVAPDWIDQLSRDWDRCASAGKLIIGSWHPVNLDHPTLGHINGNLMFSPDLAKRITIPDVPENKPWDTFLADVFAPVWARTGLIKNLNRHRTASVKQLTTPECGTKPPVLIHGVRDNSAWDYVKTK